MSLNSFIEKLGEAPDNQLDKQFTDMCKSFVKDEHSEGECIAFLRNIRDCCVRYSASSSFVIKAISVMIDQFPESSEGNSKRISMLEEWESGKIDSWDLSL